eukprot:2170604-Rhodomonas_salina.2
MASGPRPDLELEGLLEVLLGVQRAHRAEHLEQQRAVIAVAVRVLRALLQHALVDRRGGRQHFTHALQKHAVIVERVRVVRVLLQGSQIVLLRCVVLARFMQKPAQVAVCSQVVLVSFQAALIPGAASVPHIA